MYGSKRKWNGAYPAVIALAVALLVVTACGSSAKKTSSSTVGSTATSGSSPTSAAVGTSQASASGVTANSITVGLIAPVTGVESPDGVGMAQSAQARINVQNAQGGVNGRQLKLVVEDDTSTSGGNLTAAQVLVKNKGVFAVDDNSGFTFGAVKFLQQDGIPVVGGGYDASEWGQQPYTNMFSTESSLWDSHSPQYTQPAALMKQLGVTTAASLGFAISPSSSAAAKGFAVAAKDQGLAVGYVNSSLPFGTVDTTSVALAMKQAHVNGIDFSTDSATAFAVITSAKQAGLQMKAAIVPNGYGQSLLKQPTAVQAAQGVVFDPDGWAPVELASPATRAMQTAFQKYYHYTGVPDFGWYQGWTSMDLMIKGLEVAGSNPTRQSFISNLRQVSDYTAGGLLPAPTNFTQFGQAPAQECAWYVKLVGQSFVLVPSNGQPICGTLIPNSNQA